jgi:hypothetical protein
MRFPTKLLTLAYLPYLFLLLIFPQRSQAQDQLSVAPSPYLDQQYPTQQFVVADPQEPPARVSAADATTANSASVVSPSPPLTPVVVPTQNQSAPADAATDRDPYNAITGVRSPQPSPAALGEPTYGPSPPAPTPTNVNPQYQAEMPKVGLQFAQPPANPPVQLPTQNPAAPATNSLVTNPLGMASDEAMFAPSKPIVLFQGGLDDRMFIQCERMAAGACSQTKDNAKFTMCLAEISKQPACQQFVVFAALSRFGIKDDMDVFQKYNEANLTLIHLTRGGTQYPGDYFIVGNNGSFVDINTGREAQALDVTRDPNYPSISMRYPQVQLWSLIDRPPRIEPSVQGSGIKMIFSYQLRNGCATCDLVGYADAAFDFSDNGSLKKASLLGLREVK